MAKIARVLLWTAAVVGVFVGLARLTVLRWWTVPTDDPVLDASIAPTLRGGDVVLLWRFTPPRFGSLVVCPDPDDSSSVVVGRIVAEERDKLVVEGDNVEINDQRAATEHACGERIFTVVHPQTGNEVEQFCEVEALGGVSHMRGTVQGMGAIRQRTERDVGEGKVYLVSDNRAFPFDSRQYGSVDRETCKESIFFRLWSKEGFFDVKNRFTYVR